MGTTGGPTSPLMTLDAEIRVPTATVQLARFHVHEPADTIRDLRDTYWLDLCLTPRPHNARACYRDHWSPHRFERIGKLMLLPPGEVVQARSDGGPSQASVLCHLVPEALCRWFDGDLHWADRRLEATLDIPDSHLRALLLRLVDELRQPGFASATLVELVVAQIAIELARYCTEIRNRAPAGGLAAWRLRLIDERLREATAAPSLTELAELCSLSVRQLTRGYRASRGRSIGDHIAESRIDHARALLRGDQSVKAIAYTLGFSSPSSFCFAFRRATGHTPRDYRLRVLRGH
ncbi:MAG: helix-turn-helix transcriptional regulator [Sinimarinibacterium flocculans]|uniref:helix-turn-helix transcriptional regulator n=1 Tax=Sinimarinibacterium flocculans TaxID=985250 RepID=UPI003C51956D